MTLSDLFRLDLSNPWLKLGQFLGKLLHLSIPGNVDGKSGVVDIFAACLSKAHQCVKSKECRLVFAEVELAFFLSFLPVESTQKSFSIAVRLNPFFRTPI
jgi:hypothetical protein